MSAPFSAAESLVASARPEGVSLSGESLAALRAARRSSFARRLSRLDCSRSRFARDCGVRLAISSVPVLTCR